MGVEASRNGQGLRQVQQAVVITQGAQPVEDLDLIAFRLVSGKGQTHS